MMMGPMKKKVVTSVVVTAIVLFIIFGAIAVVYVSQTNKEIAVLKEKGEVVQRYVFAQDMLIGDVITEDDIILVDVKGESAASDSYIDLTLSNGKSVIVRDDRRIDVLLDSTIYEDEDLGLIGKRLKVNANEKTIITSSLFFEEDKDPTIYERLQEFNMITLPSDLDVGDYIDVRIRFATGEDFSVLTGKRVYSLGALESKTNTIFLKLDEEEIVRMGSAILESYIRDGVNLYANKYVDPANQLFDYERIDYVAKYEDALYKIIESGDVVETISGEGSNFAIGDKVMRTVSEIATIIGLNEEETENIKVALNKEDESTLQYYKNKVKTTEVEIATTYPVKLEIAKLIENNPNIVQEIKNKYNVETLMNQREYFLNTDLTQVDEFGVITDHEDHMESIKAKLEEEIKTQKSERQEYLLNLLGGQSSTDETIETEE